MASTIDTTKPSAGNATTESVRNNFAIAKSEIEALQISLPTIATVAENSAATAANSATDAANSAAAAASSAATATAAGQTRIVSAITETITTPNADISDVYKLTAAATAILIANPTGTPSDLQAMMLYIKDNGTQQAIAWGTQYRGEGVALPTLTTIGKGLRIAFLYDAQDGKWDCIGTV